MTTSVRDSGPRPPGAIGPRAFLVDGAALDPIAGGDTRPSRRGEFAPNASLVSRVDLTPSVARFMIRPDGGVSSFRLGQYFAIGLQVDGALRQRPYSTASPPGAVEQVEFLVRRVECGSFTPHLWRVPPAGRLWLGPPKGLFTLRPGDSRRHLFVSTGTGLAPFISMSEAILRSQDDGAGARDAAIGDGPGPRIVVVHGVSHASELAYRDRLEAWSAAGRLSYVPTISRAADPANAGWTGSTGRTEAILGRVCDTLDIDPDDTVAYLCGNPEMI